MKILLVNDYATPTGGAELQMLSLRDNFRRRGHDAQLFASDARPGTGDCLADYRCLGTTSGLRTLLQTANPWAFAGLRRVLAEFRPDVVHVRIFLTQLSPLIMPLLREVPSLYHVVWYRSICPTGVKLLPDGTSCQFRAGTPCYANRCLPLWDWPFLMLQLRLWHRWRKAFNLIVANSEAGRQRMMAEGIEPVSVVWNGVPARPLRPPLSSPPTVAFGGRLVREKGVDVLLTAFSRLLSRRPDARLLLAGEGPEREALQKLIVDLGISSSVSLLGHLSQSEMEKQFAAAWVQAVPSRWEEPFANVALEALMRGTAVVASASGGLVEMIREGLDGFLVEPNNPDDLAAALLRLLDNRSLAERMGKTANERARAQFSQEACADRFIQLYRTICKTEST